MTVAALAAGSIGVFQVGGRLPVLHALTSNRPRTRYPSGAGAKRVLFMRRHLADRRFDRIALRAGGLDGF